MIEFDEGDEVWLKAKVARANREQAFIEFTSMEGPYSIRVPLDQLAHDYDEAADERARIVWWLRAAVHGPNGSGTTPEYLTALTDLADRIEQHPERFAEAPPHREGRRS